MVVKSPYSFLIKHFRKIHLVLLLISIYVYIKTMNVYSFVKQFLSLGTYDYYSESISKYISPLLYIATLFIIIITAIILLLLKHKKKPWKLYVVPLISYTLLFITFIITSNFFNSYTGQTETAAVRAMRDFLVLTTLPQYGFFVILIIRTLGIDLKKFNFKADQEFLELTSEDKKEFEINIEIDKESYKRFFKRLIRNLNYLYQEHKRVVSLVLVILMGIILYNSYKYIFITNKTYKTGDTFQNSGYEITINNSYFTDKDYKGDIVDKNKNFLIVDVTIKNNATKRKINFNRFHIVNGIKNYTPTSKTYETYFQDLGTAYEEKTIAKLETYRTLLIYKVDKELSRDRFVMYYQELNGNTNHLRKIKLKTKDLSKINVQESKNLTEEINLNINGIEENIIFDSLTFVTTTTYSKKVCDAGDCYPKDTNFTISPGYKILQMDFISDETDGKDMIDFLSKYGKINYIDSKGKNVALAIENAVNKSYYGKYVYIKVPEGIDNENKIYLDITIRNNKYQYILK